jgi:hypothetical protein
LMMALSMLVIDSKRASPRMIRIAEVISISGYPYVLQNRNGTGRG